MKYNVNITSSKGTHKHGEDVVESDPDEHGIVVTREQTDILAKTLGGYVQDINEHYWLLRIDAVNPAGTVVVINGGSQMVSVFALDDIEEGLFYPTSSLLHWVRNGYNVALLMSDTGTPWGWNYSMYYEKTVDSKVVDALFKKFYRKELQSSKYEQILECFWSIAAAVAELRKENLPLHLNGHCSGAILITKYISLSDDYDYKSLTLISPIFNDHFENPVSHYMDLMRHNTKIPLLVINHVKDVAAGVSIKHSDYLLEHSKTESKHILLDGGLNLGSPNFTLSHHGFYGIVDKLVDAIANHIKLIDFDE